MYTIKRIKDKSDITTCQRFDINQFQWTCKHSPKMYGYAGLLEGKGIYIKTITEETNPKRACVTYQEKVCFDSAVEAFFAFLEPGEELTDQVMYINFEVNANAMLFANYGKGRKNRAFISDELYKCCECKTEIKEDKWIAEFIIPNEFLQSICDWSRYLQGEEFYGNFYKIAETPEIEHYGTYHKVNNETPNFHLPTSFDTVVIES